MTTILLIFTILGNTKFVMVFKLDLQVLATQASLQRKKSMPDVQDLPRATRQMPREEVSMLGSARREEIRRQVDERERLRANPLLYLVSPQVKVSFSAFTIPLLYEVCFS